MVHDLMLAVERFNSEIVGYPIPNIPQMLPNKQVEGLIEHLNEELLEFTEAVTLEDQADALMDFVYVALGALAKMGVAPRPVFEAIHEANMLKKRGENAKRPNSGGYDAVKPDGWKPADLTTFLSVTKDEILALKNISPIHIMLAELRKEKGSDYNAGKIQINDYFPFGDISYVQIIYMKALRMVSLINKNLAGGKPKFEGIPGSIMDLLNYGTFHAEQMLKESRLNGWRDGVK